RRGEFDRSHRRARGNVLLIDVGALARSGVASIDSVAVGAVAMGEMDLAIQEFLIESQENLDQLDRDLIAIEEDPAGREALDSIFRTFHTIKGTCGFFDFPRLETVTHAGEGLLGDLRDGRLEWSPAINGGLLELVDVVRRHLAGIGRTGTEL